HPPAALGEDGPAASTERGDVSLPVHGQLRTAVWFGALLCTSLTRKPQTC
ncbi:hypothetical protein Cfor_01291, partial [Coptotermes formosanus]